MSKKMASSVVFLCIIVLSTMAILPVTAQIDGDVDNNGKVDVIDLCRVSCAYGYFDWEPKYDADADLNNDGFVGWLDVQEVVNNFGTNVDSLAPQLPSGTTWVKVIPGPQLSVLVGDYFDVDVQVFGVNGLHQYQFMLSWDLSDLPIEYISVVEGPFLQSGGPTVFVYRDTYLPMDRLLVGCTILGQTSSVSGSGTLATVRFKCAGSTTGHRPINLVCQLFDVYIGPINHNDMGTRLKQQS